MSGIDLDVVISPSEWFQLSLVYSYMDAVYNDYIDPILGDLENGDFPNSPRNQLSITPIIKLPMPDGAGDMSFMASYYYQSEIATDPANTPNGNPQVELSSQGAWIPSWDKLDLRLDWSNVLGSQVSLAAFVKNATDEEYLVGTANQLSTLFGQLAYLYGEPRTYGMEIRYSFGN